MNAHYKSIIDKQGLKTSNRLQKINQKFKNIQNNVLNNTVFFIIEKCKEHDVATKVLEYNKDLQFKGSMEKTKPNIHAYCIQTIQRKT